MKNIYIFLTFCFFSFASSAQITFHDYSAPTINHDTISMSQFYGKKVMVVNTATYCAYTPQFTALEQLYTDYKSYGFEIIGFPCNDFANQDPHDDSTINQFCTSTYNVTFQMMSKVKTVATPIDPIYQWLEQSTLNGVSNATVSWNFNKFLIDEAGHWVRHYTQTTLPNDPAIISWIVDSASVVSGIKETKTDDLIEMKSANPGSSIDFSFKNPAPQNLNICLYNTEGQLIKNIFTGIAENGQFISNDVSSLTSGVYMVRITGKGIQKTLKYVIVK